MFWEEKLSLLFGLLYIFPTLFYLHKLLNVIVIICITHTLCVTTLLFPGYLNKPFKHEKLFCLFLDCNIFLRLKQKFCLFNAENTYCNPLGELIIFFGTRVHTVTLKIFWLFSNFEWFIMLWWFLHETEQYFFSFWAICLSWFVVISEFTIKSVFLTITYSHEL